MILFADTLFFPHQGWVSLDAGVPVLSRGSPSTKRFECLRKVREGRLEKRDLCNGLHAWGPWLYGSGFAPSGREVQQVLPREGS
jgi:hypothetical protein